jgi:phage host-nuclease inhibitor protein Gam
MATDDLPEAIENPPPDWRPTNQLDVERALRRLERLAARYGEVQQQAVEWRADITEWEQRHLADLSEEATRLNMALEHWATEQRALSGGKTMSWDFPSGRISTSKARSKNIVDDEAAAIEWCAENLPAAVKVETTLLSSVVAKACEVVDGGRFVTPDGEVVPGVRKQVLPDSAVTAEVKLASQRALPKASR